MDKIGTDIGMSYMVPKEMMSNGAKKLWNVYERKSDAPIYQREFGFYSLERWINEAKLIAGLDYEYFNSIFGFDKPGNHNIYGLGGCEAAFLPEFEEKTIEDRGEHEVAQDHADRHVLYFKGRRSGFMPEYLDHPVKDMKTWKRQL